MPCSTQNSEWTHSFQVYRRAEQDAFLNGDGKNKPTGIFDPEKGGEIGVTAASTSIKADEVIDLVYSLKRPYRKSAAFIMNDQTLASIRKLKDSTGQYLWQPGLQAGEPDRILGYPVYTSAYCPVAEAGKPVRLAENNTNKFALYFGNRYLIVRHLFEAYIMECLNNGGMEEVCECEDQE